MRNNLNSKTAPERAVDTFNLFGKTAFTLGGMAYAAIDDITGFVSRKTDEQLENNPNGFVATRMKMSYGENFVDGGEIYYEAKEYVKVSKDGPNRPDDGS